MRTPNFAGVELMNQLAPEGEFVFLLTADGLLDLGQIEHVAEWNRLVAVCGESVATNAFATLCTRMQPHDGTPSAMFETIVDWSSWQFKFSAVVEVPSCGRDVLTYDCRVAVQEIVAG